MSTTAVVNVADQAPPRRLDCPACGSTARPAFRSPDRNRGLASPTFTYRRCPRCRLLFLEDVPADLASYYDENYHSRPATIAALRQAADRERFKIDLLTRYARSGRLLEIGPSYGLFISLAQAAGFTVDAVEPDSECRALIAAWLGARTLESVDAPELMGSDEVYDAIALWQSFEHLPGAWAFLDQAARLLRPGGVLLIATPNPDSFQARVFGRRWTHLDAPRHIDLAPWDTLSEQGRARGLETTTVTMTDRGSLGWNSFGWSESLARFARTGWRSSVLRFAGRVVALLLRPWERRGWRGSAYVIVLRKP